MTCLATLEASYIDHGTEFSKHLSNLQALHIGHNEDIDGDRVATLEVATANFTMWRPRVDNLLV